MVHVACKIRYNHRQEDKEVDLDEDELKWKREEELDRRKVYDMARKEMNFGNVRATDSRNNKRIHVGKSRNIGEDSEIKIRKNTWNKQHSDYMKKRCKENGKL